MRRPLAALTLLLLSACGAPGPYGNANLSGNVIWSEPVVYGPDASLIVYLVDASGPESSLEVELQKVNNPEPGAELYAGTSIEGMLRSPEDFAFAVPLEHVDQGHDYRLKAVITDRGRPVMATAEGPLVLTKGRPLRVDLTVEPVPGS